MSWLDALNVGDKVLIDRWQNRGSWYVPATVEKVLKLHIVANGRKFRRSTGHDVRDRGAPYVSDKLVPYDEKLLASRRDTATRDAVWRKLVAVVESCRHHAPAGLDVNWMIKTTETIRRAEEEA